MLSKITCQCCGKKYSTRLFGTDLYTICPNCNWEQDEDLKSETEPSPANFYISILEARQNIKNLGSISGIPRKFYQRKIKLYI